MKEYNLKDGPYEDKEELNRFCDQLGGETKLIDGQGGGEDMVCEVVGRNGDHMWFGSNGHLGHPFVEFGVEDADMTFESSARTTLASDGEVKVYEMNEFEATIEGEDGNVQITFDEERF